MSRRISGWKAIGAYFGRDRSTVIRWAQDRALPVRYMPGGGGKKTVYAMSDELDAWAGGAAVAAAIEPVEPEAIEAPSPLRRLWPVRLGIVAFVLFAVASALWIALPPRASVDMPADPAVAALYLQGRDNWAQRDAASLSRAIDELEQVTRADPGFAPAFSALADAYLLTREFGSMPDSLAFSRARQAAERALALDPKLASAHRAMGFVAYWWEHDRATAGRAFRRALELDPANGQTRFWYGNVLADNGEHGPAMRELDAARLTDPGSIAIATDRAWAAWSAGNTAPAIAELQAILSRSPAFAVAHDCLGIIRLSEGDIAAYLDSLRKRENSRADPQLSARTEMLEAAMRSGGAAAVHQKLIDFAIADERESAFPDHAWAGFVASLAGDRARLLEILRLAERQHQAWGSSGYSERIAGRWKDDAEITALLRRRVPPRIET